MRRAYQLDAVAVRFITPATTAHINTSRADLAADGTASAVETAQAAWARPHGLGHQTPSHGTLVVTCSDAQLSAIQWDARVEVDATLAGITTRILAGWITGYTRTRRPGGLWRVEVTIEDAAARAAALQVGDTPWPAYQLANDRLARLAQLTGGLISATPVYPPSDPRDQKPTCGPRDVDSQRALELIEACAVPGWVTAPTSQGKQLTLRPVPGTSVRWPAALDGGYIYPPAATPGGPDPIPIAAAQIGDVPRSLDRTAMVSRVAWTHTKVRTVPPATAELYTGTDQWVAGTGRAAAEIAWTSDVLYTGNPIEDPVPKLAARILAENTTPGESLDGPARIYDLDPQLLAALIDVDRRALATINITARPPGVAQFQRLIGGTIRITRGALTLDVILQPARLSGLRPAQFSDAPTGAAGRIQEMGTLRLSDLTLTSH